MANKISRIRTLALYAKSERVRKKNEKRFMVMMNDVPKCAKLSNREPIYF